jgi:type I restriction enzyme S subunit
MTKVTNIPDGWTKKRLGDIALVTKLAGFEFSEYIKYDDSQEIIAIRALNLKNGKLDLSNIKKISKDISNKLIRSKLFVNDLVLSYVGTIGEVAIIDKNDTYHLAPNVCKLSLDNNDSNYIKNLLISDLGKREIDKHLTTSSQPALSMGNVRELSFIMPKDIKEQEKISNILTSWDDMIDLQSKKVEQLMQEKQSRLQTLLKPKGDWEETRLGELINQRSVRNKGTKVSRVLSVSNKNGFVLPEEQFARTVASKDLSNYKVVYQGDYAYNPSRINVGSIARLDNYDIGIVSPMYVVVTPLENKINSEYFYQWISSYEAKEKIKRSASGSVRETVDYTAFSSLKISISKDINEQIKIANILKSYDELIKLNKNKLDELNEQKKGLMQKLLTGEVRV